MTYTYMQTTDKNGKRKVVSRSEYEANTSEQLSLSSPVAEQASIEPEVTCTALVVPFTLEAAIAELRERERLELTAPSVEETALDTVKAIIAGMGGKHSNKVRIQETKKGVQIRYRNCAVCSLVFDAAHILTGIRFMGTTLETVKEATVRKPASLSAYTDEIVEQVTFIDWWWKDFYSKSAS